jgi:hypothetical protein
VDENFDLTAEKLSAIDTLAYLLRMTVYGIQTLVGDAFIVSYKFILAT